MCRGGRLLLSTHELASGSGGAWCCLRLSPGFPEQASHCRQCTTSTASAPYLPLNDDKDKDSNADGAGQCRAAHIHSLLNASPSPHAILNAKFINEQMRFFRAEIMTVWKHFPSKLRALIHLPPFDLRRVRIRC